MKRFSETPIDIGSASVWLYGIDYYDLMHNSVNS
jgi:hypothetical protein